jgi:hypothetical protein
MAFHDGADWGAWRAWRNEPFEAQQMKLRFTLDRVSERYQAHVAPDMMLQVFGAAPDAVTGLQLLEGWWQDDVPQTQTNVEMARFVSGAAFASKAIMPRAGSVVGVSVKSTEAEALDIPGSLSVEVWKNGVATGLVASMDPLGDFAQASQAAGLDAFVAGDELDVRITTNGWEPNTADVRAAVEARWA